MPPRPDAPRKYQPLHDYLTAHPGDRVTLTLAEIEAIIGAALPAGARQRTWWQITQGPTGVRSTVHAAGWRIVLDSFWGRNPAVTFVRNGAEGAPPEQA